MIKINTIYRTKNDYFIVIMRNPEFECYEMYVSLFLSNLQDFDYLLKYGHPILAFDNLSVARCYAREIIDGKVF